MKLTIDEYAGRIIAEVTAIEKYVEKADVFIPELDSYLRDIENTGSVQIAGNNQPFYEEFYKLKN